MTKKKYDDLSVRMKEYEGADKTFFPKRLPVLIRIDGRAFHTYTKGMKKPFDEALSEAMWETTKYLCETIQGCKIGYTQSDEITLLLINYKPDKMTCDPYFNNNRTKIETSAASKATKKFNQFMSKKWIENMVKNGASSEEIAENYPGQKDWAEFDARAWVLPKEEVNNAFIWRQQDATKNSISMVAQANFSHKSLQGLNGSQLQDKLFQEKGINWNDLPAWQKRGAAIIKRQKPKTVAYNGNEVTVMRNVWETDFETPIFSQDKNYIEQYVYPKKETE